MSGTPDAAPVPGDERRRIARGRERLESENARLRAELERKSRETAMLGRISHELASAYAVRELLFCIARGAHAAVRADGAYVEEIDSARDEVEVVAGAGERNPPIGTRAPYPGSLAEAAVRRGEPEIVPDLTAVDRPIRSSLRKACGACDGLVAPLISEGEALGALVLLRPRGAPSFTADDVDRVRTLSDLAAVSLRRVRVLEETRRQRERAERAERRYRSLFVHNPNPVVVLDPEGRVANVNPAAERLGGYSPVAIVGPHFDRLILREDRDRAWGAFRRALAGASQFLALRVRRPDGRLREIEVVAVPMMVSGGSGGVFAIIRDVSERREAEAALQRSERRLRTTLEALPIGVWFTDRSGRIIYGNPAGRRIWGGARYVGPNRYGEYKGWWPDTGRRIEAHEWALARALTRGEISIDEEVEIEAFDGTRKILRNSAVPLVGDRGEVYGALVVNEDITARRRAERERERAAESRTRWVRGMSHDLKNPLGAADGQLALLESGVHEELTGEQRRAIARARSSLRSALGLIDDLSDLARAEAGRIEIRPRPTRLWPIVEEAADEHRAVAAASDLALEVVGFDRRLVVTTDPRRVAQILGNLLSNAIKYTPAGGRIVLRGGAREGGGARRPRRSVAVEVSDSGPGIPPDKRDEVFEEFSRLDADSRRGAGLGLAISRRLARLLGGEITVESEPGQGSTFTLWLPLDAATG